MLSWDQTDRKSALSYVLSGKDGYEVVIGSVKLDGLDILEMEPEEELRQACF